jgi:hypothetical protein
MSLPERPSPGARDRFLKAASQLSPLPPRTWARRIARGSLGASAWLLATLLVLGIRHDWHDLPMAGWAATLAALSGGALVAAVLGAARGRTMVGPSTERLSAVAVTIPLLLLLLVVGIDPHGPRSVAGTPWNAWVCGLLSLGIALPLLGIGRWVSRDLILARPGLVGACLGVAAATFAHLVIRIHCPVSGPGHAVLGHLLPLLPLMAMGAWLGAARR